MLHPCKWDLCLEQWPTASKEDIGRVLASRWVTCFPLSLHWLQDETNGFAQLTARVRARHLFAAYNGKGQLVSGQPDKEFPVQVRCCCQSHLQTSQCLLTAGMRNLGSRAEAAANC